MLNKSQTVITHSEAETIEFGKRFAETLKAGDVIALYAQLATGKTYFTKGIAQGLGITETVTSPTFTIVSEYGGGRLHLYHVDAYRLASAEDFLDIGAEEMLYGDGVCVIEWAEFVEAALPPHCIRITVTVQSDGSRIFSIRGGEVS